jgi:hypothetical protein
MESLPETKFMNLFVRILGASDAREKRRSGIHILQAALTTYTAKLHFACG